MESIDRRLSSIPGLRVTRQMPLAEATTWNVGGPADYFVMVETRPALEKLLLFCETEAVPMMVIGNGSNLLVSDRGYRGVVCSLGSEFRQVVFSGEVMKSGGAVGLSRTVVDAMEAGLSGLGFAAGIPGTVGGAVMTNAGAFNGDMASVVKSIMALGRDGEYREFREFGGEYRKKLIPVENIVVEAELALKRESHERIRSRVERNLRERREKQPVGQTTAGSVFKNPPGASAGRLIEDCGLKGTAVGGAYVSERHANFIVNSGEASAEDILTLIDTVREKVREKSGIELELEVELIGF